MARPVTSAPDPTTLFSRRALGRSRLPIVIALGLAVGARTMVPPVPDAAEAVAAPAVAAALPTRAEHPPEARPALPTGLALVVPAVSISPLPSPLRERVELPLAR